MTRVCYICFTYCARLLVGVFCIGMKGNAWYAMTGVVFEGGRAAAVLWMLIAHPPSASTPYTFAVESSFIPPGIH